jgi:hypothetical protein
MLYTEILPDDMDQPGITKQQFETAISVWTWMQPGDAAPTVAATGRPASRMAIARVMKPFSIVRP